MKPEHSDIEDGDPQLLKPAEFKRSLLEGIRSAGSYVLIKSFVWRNDSFGNEVATALLEAAGRSVEVYVVKDRLGSIYEYAEPNGQSFFHDDAAENVSNAVWGKMVACLYGYRHGKPQKNPMRREFNGNPHIHVTEDEFYDHSKVVVIDGKEAYVSGINFGDEHLEQDGVWDDFSLRITGESECLNLLELLAGRKQERNGNGVEFQHGTSEALQDDLARFILGTREELLICMAYLGDPVFTDALVEVVRNRRKVEIIVPLNPSVNRSNNVSVLHRLTAAAKGDGELLSVVLSPALRHGKGLCRDRGTVLVGSKNMTVGTSLADTIAVTGNKDVAGTFQRAAGELRSAAECDLSGAALQSRFGSISAADRLLSHLETKGPEIVRLVHGLVGNHMEASRRRSQNLVRQIISDFH